jgi:transcriptional regulator with XRE-family HTH domain
MTGYSYTWLRYWRERAGIPQGELAKRVRRSKGTVNALERGSQYPSPGLAQSIVSQLEKKLHVGLRVQDVFPADPSIKSPDELAHSYWEDIREASHLRDEDQADGSSRESLEEREIRQQQEACAIQYRHELEQMSDEERRAWRPTTIDFGDGIRITEQPPAWFIKRVHEARQRMPSKDSHRKPRKTTAKPRSRQRRSTRKRKVSKASSSDDPGEPEPELGPPEFTGGAIPCFVLVLPDCEADHG